MFVILTTIFLIFVGNLNNEDWNIRVLSYDILLYSRPFSDVAITKGLKSESPETYKRCLDLLNAGWISYLYYNWNDCLEIEDLIYGDYEFDGMPWLPNNKVYKITKSQAKIINKFFIQLTKREYQVEEDYIAIDDVRFLVRGLKIPYYDKTYKIEEEKIKWKKLKKTWRK